MRSGIYIAFVKNNRKNTYRDGTSEKNGECHKLKD